MNKAKILDTVLLLALPASGKSEVRKYLAELAPEVCRTDFHMGPTVQLDDFPYVHLMRRIDDELMVLGKERIFFPSSDTPFKDPMHWGTLMELINEDYADLISGKTYHPESAAELLLARFERSANKIGARGLEALDAQTRAAVAEAIEKEANSLLDERNHNCSQDLKGKTIVIEFARGGADGSTMPLKAPFGYQYSLSLLSPTILSRAGILYIWVTPEESRRKNMERSNPSDPGSILHHGVPIKVMMNDYGCDDLAWLEENSKKPGAVSVEAGGKRYDVPIARFDNRIDKTSFIRGDRSNWKAEQINAVHEGLKAALSKLAVF